MEGQVLGNRYELIEKIGGGGMALVFKARCRLLNRFVAVKVLRNEYINDEGFVKRFKIEAQAAASLSHPNIVSIFDVGHENETHYIVMELVDGITLKEYIKRKGMVPWAEAINITSQICSAIEHAHKNHIVHRDIKPHNILFTNEGIAKVADFGIARAATFSTITMSGSTMGSVHYFSPEQARGGYTDEKSDIYSIGIVLFEMVTGRVPFDGESPVGVALKQIELRPPVPIEINPNIPVGLNSVILNALEKEKSRRYKSAGEMLGELNQVLRSPEQNRKRIEDHDDNPTRTMSTVDTNRERTGPESKIKSGEEILRSQKNEKEKNKNKNRKTIFILVIAVIIVLPILSYVSVYNILPLINGTQQKEYVVDDYRGSYFNIIREQLKEKGIEVREARKFDEKIPKDTIISQDKQKGDSLIIGGYNNFIEFVVSGGPQLMVIPDSKNNDYRQAEAKLGELGLVFKTQEEFSDEVPKGLVTRTEPATGTEVKPKSVVVIYKSKGPEQKTTMVPYLIGETRVAAAKLLVDAKLTVGKVIPENSVNASDIVKSQEPEANQKVEEGSGVDLYFDSSLGLSTARKTIYKRYSLNYSQNYPDKFRLYVDAEPSDTKQKEEVFNQEVEKSSFPMVLPIPLPTGGSTKVKVYVNNQLDSEFIEK